jgi:hypothetical protein
MPEGRGAKRTIHFVVKGPHRSETKFSVASVSPADLHVEVGEPDTSNAKIRLYPVTIEVPADAAPINLLGTEGGRTGRIVLDTTHPAIKHVELRVTYVVRE